MRRFPLPRDRLKTFTELEFIPFNPTDKRTEATVRSADGRVMRVRGPSQWPVWGSGEGGMSTLHPA
jgi:hypothetical protein